MKKASLTSIQITFRSLNTVPNDIFDFRVTIDLKWDCPFFEVLLSRQNLNSIHRVPFLENDPVLIPLPKYYYYIRDNLVTYVQ